MIQIAIRIQKNTNFETNCRTLSWNLGGFLQHLWVETSKTTEPQTQFHAAMASASCKLGALLSSCFDSCNMSWQRKKTKRWIKWAACQKAAKKRTGPKKWRARNESRSTPCLEYLVSQSLRREISQLLGNQLGNPSNVRWFSSEKGELTVVEWKTVNIELEGIEMVSKRVCKKYASKTIEGTRHAW